MTTAPPLIQMQGISKTYQTGQIEVHALQAIDLSITGGEFAALVGQSGSGKTTLMNLIGCLDRPTTGSYRIDGTDVSTLRDDGLAEIRRDRIGFVFQNFNLLGRASAQENVELPLLYARHCSERERRQRAQEALERVGLSDRLRHHPNQLSGGQQQRVAIARALVARPQIILADEPTGNLDSRSGADVLDLLERLNGEGVTLILVTHNVILAERAPRCILLRDGRIERDTAAESVL